MKVINMKFLARWTTWTGLAGIVALSTAFGHSSSPLIAVASEAVAPIEITVYKSPTCGCCSKWVDHINANGFKAIVHDTSDMAPVKTKLGVPRAMESCHTAVVNGYVIEGHVPAADIHRLLRERPKVAGLSVPGMVTGSPGMEGNRTDPYSVVTFGTGTSSVFSRH